MRKYRFVVALAFIVPCGCIANSSASNDDVIPKDGVIAFTYETGPRFGCANEQITFKHDFVVANPFRTRVLQLTLLSKSCGCLTNVPSQLTIQPLKNVVVSLSGSRSVMGSPLTYSWDVTYETNDEPRVKVIISLIARLIPRLATEVVSAHSGDVLTIDVDKGPFNIVLDVLSRQPLTEEECNIRVATQSPFSVKFAGIGSEVENQDIRLRKTRVYMTTSDPGMLARLRENSETLKAVIHQGTLCSLDMTRMLRVPRFVEPRPPVLYVRLDNDRIIERLIQVSAERDFSIVAVTSAMNGITIANKLGESKRMHTIRLLLNSKTIRAALGSSAKSGVHRVVVKIQTSHSSTPLIVVPLFIVRLD